MTPKERAEFNALSRDQQRFYQTKARLNPSMCHKILMRDAINSAFAKKVSITNSQSNSQQIKKSSNINTPNHTNTSDMAIKINIDLNDSTEYTSDQEFIYNRFSLLRTKYNDALENLESLKFFHTDSSKIHTLFLDVLIRKIKELQKERRSIEKNLIWDHLVIGFFGETNAGKSTIIETLRLKYGIGERNWVHGEIIGTGDKDFTKGATEYPLEINGNKVTLIDIPGIEGNEEKYTGIIKNALRRAHFIFYVHQNEKSIDEAIASRVKSYLAEWAKVFLIWNIPGTPDNFDEEEERITLLTDQRIKQLQVIDGKFKRLLGKKYFAGSIHVQALLAIASCGTFPNHAINRKVNLLRTFFESTKALYEFSNMAEVAKIIDDSCHKFPSLLKESQLQKLTALKKQSEQEISELLNQHNEDLEQLYARLSALNKEITNIFNHTISNIQRGIIDETINSEMRSLEDGSKRIILARDVTEDEKKKKLKEWQQIIAQHINSGIKDVIKENSERLKKNVSESLRNFHDSLKTFKFHFNDISLCLEGDVDINASHILKQLKFSFADGADILAALASGAAAGSYFGPQGAFIGAIVGGLSGVCKSFFLQNKRKKALSALNASIRSITTDLNIKAEESIISPTKEKLHTELGQISKVITSEMANIHNMQTQLNQFYQSL
ncbi:MAG: hypothetical protein HDR86_10075 [Bacteroides sp.]|nr:hypothetical protein [Bacteroides sp.]